MQNKRVAILGAGSIGTVLGAMMTAGGVAVDLIDSYQAHVDALNSKGATIVGPFERTIPVHAITTEQMEGIYDVVFLICKQTGTKQAVEQLLPHLNDDSVVCTLQNGLPERHLAALIGEKRTVGGIVLFPATWEAPGVSRLTVPKEYLDRAVLLEVGEMDGSVTPRIQEIRDLLSPMGHVVVTESLMSTRWFKVCVNSSQSGLSAVIGDAYKVAMVRRDAMLSMAHVTDEAVRVAHAAGAKDLEYMEDWYLHGDMTIEKIMDGLYDHFKGSGDMKASMLQDLEKGRPCEIDFINGEVVAAGKRLGIPTPFNEMYVAIIKAAQSRKTVWLPDEAMAFIRPMLTQLGEL